MFNQKYAPPTNNETISTPFKNKNITEAPDMESNPGSN